jgi:hypothetical protein
LGMAQVADEEIRQPTVASRACQPLSAVSRLPARASRISWLANSEVAWSMSSGPSTVRWTS